MDLKKFGVTLLAIVLVFAIAAASAFATENWNPSSTGAWYTGASPGTKLAVGTGTIDLTVSGGTSNLTGTILGSPFKLESTSVKGTKCSATNPTTTSATIDCENLVFSGVTVSGAAVTGCSTPTTLTTRELTDKLGMNKAGTLATLEITPKAGAGNPLATLELTGSCSNAGLYKVTGEVFLQAKNATGVFAKKQEFTSSEAIQKDAGTATSLRFGASGMFLNASIAAEAAVEWAGKES